jgi:hypothetical protein
MGYSPERTVYKLDFTGTEHEGLEISAYAPSVGLLLEAKRLMELDGDLPRAYAAFLDHVESWNLELPDGTAALPVMEDFTRFESPFINSVVVTWIRGRAEVSVPLERPSSDGSPEMSIPMEALSPSLAS